MFGLDQAEKAPDGILDTRPSSNDAGHREIALGDLRRMEFDLLENAKSAHHISSLAEVDFTEYRSAVKAYRRNGRGLSLFAFILKGLADELHEHPSIQSYRSGRRKAVEFSDVDLAFMVEKRYEGRHVPATYIIRNAHAKSLDEIHEEVERRVAAPLEDDSPFVGRKTPLAFRLYPRLPGFLRMTLWRYVGTHPFFIRDIGGTALVTSLANFPGLSSWVLPLAGYPFVLGIGSLMTKPWVVGGRVEARQIQNLTFQFNHDFVDGGEAARFVQGLMRRYDALAKGLGGASE